jgi:hypothetical protein
MSVRVSSNRPTGFHINIAKSVLKDSQTVSLEGLGMASTIALKTANKLIDFGYATLGRLETGHFGSQKTGTSRLTVVLERSDEFFEKIDEYEKARANAN